MKISIKSHNSSLFTTFFVGTCFGWRHHPLGTYAPLGRTSTSYGYPRYLVKTINHSQKGHQIHLRSPQKKQEKHIFFFVKVWETKMRRTKENICGQKTLTIWKDVSGPMCGQSVELLTPVLILSLQKNQGSSFWDISPSWLMWSGHQLLQLLWN